MPSEREPIREMVPVTGKLFVWFKPQGDEKDVQTLLRSVRGYTDAIWPEVGPGVVHVPFGTEEAALGTLRASSLVSSARRAMEPRTKGKGN